MPSITDIPLELFIDNLLPNLLLQDILSLAAVNKDFSALCSDDTFWKRKLKDDYNFSDVASARTKGYKFLYKGVHKARTYVWGANGEGRLGLGQLKLRGGVLNRGVPYPRHLKVSESRIVDLAASGWGFHAIDSEGSMHVWGQLDGEGHSLEVDPFCEPCKRVNVPVKLSLPERISTITCGRKHATALSANNRIWEFTNWGVPYIITSDTLSPAHDHTTPIQVESGWTFSVALTQAGDIYFWRPFADEVLVQRTRERYDHFMNTSSVEERPLAKNGVVKCFPFEVDASPRPLPPISAKLPSLRGDEMPVGDKIIKIAAGDKFVIALTEGGHVLKMDLPNLEGDWTQPRWQYLHLFSERDHIINHPTFQNNAIPVDFSTIRITHISAHFMNFFAYSTGVNSIVLQGAQRTTNDDPPHISPSLQHRNVISIVQGDYHNGALTSTGQLLTWGNYSSGALGLGDPTKLPLGAPGGYERDEDRVAARRTGVNPPTVREPQEVTFGSKKNAQGEREPRKTFVFKATAAGWHTGALVIDLEDEELEDTDSEREEPSFEQPPAQNHWTAPPFYGHMPFRVGLAGARGRGRRGH